ncbi:hypothetical protein [Streptomyces sp. NPDC093109]|uniref:hypothetical protein n=1 Tax=Streptomyces sp. NPDC093109 TaxID=3154977 RepID=UPI003450F24E
MRPARPTLRCLRDDLDLPVPAVTVPLAEIGHPLLAKAAEQFSGEDSKHERIRSVDDQVLFKVKVQRWRGAVWIDADLPWLVAAGGARTARVAISMPRWNRTGRRLGPSQRQPCRRAEDVHVHRPSAAGEGRPRQVSG